MAVGLWAYDTFPKMMPGAGYLVDSGKEDIIFTIGCFLFKATKADWADTGQRHRGSIELRPVTPVRKGGGKPWCFNRAGENPRPTGFWEPRELPLWWTPAYITETKGTMMVSLCVYENDVQFAGYNL